MDSHTRTHTGPWFDSDRLTAHPPPTKLSDVASKHGLDFIPALVLVLEPRLPTNTIRVQPTGTPPTRTSYVAWSHYEYEYATMVNPSLLPAPDACSQAHRSRSGLSDSPKLVTQCASTSRAPPSERNGRRFVLASAYEYGVRVPPLTLHRRWLTSHESVARHG